jgi:hypothetical protein
MERGGRKMVSSKGPKFMMAEKSSTRVADKDMKILEKARALKSRSFQNTTLDGPGAGEGHKCTGADR